LRRSYDVHAGREPAKEGIDLVHDAGPLGRNGT
jgi:hypothetical protein